MNEHLLQFRNDFVENSILFVVFAGALSIRLYWRELFVKLLDLDTRFSRRLGVPASWITKCRRFSEGKGMLILLGIIVGLFFLLMCGNGAAYLYFRDKLPHANSLGHLL